MHKNAEILRKEALKMLGIDIGHSSVKILELQGNRIINLKKRPYPGQADSEGREDEISRILAHTITSIDARKKVAWSSVGGTSVITHLKTFPEMEESELEGAVQLEAEEFFFHDWETMDFDYHVMETLEDGGYKVLFMAAPKELSNKNIALLKEAELYPIGMSVNSLAMANAFQAASERTGGGQESNGRAVLINIGATTTSIVLLDDGRIAALRDVPFGGNDITKSLMKEFKTGFEEAESIKTHPGEPETRLTDSVERALRPLLQQISMTIGLKHRQRDQGDNSIFLAGSGCRAPRLKELIESKFNLPVKLFNPLAGLEIECEQPDDDLEMSGYAIALGSALIGDREGTKDFNLIRDRVERPPTTAEKFSISLLLGLFFTYALTIGLASILLNNLDREAEMLEERIERVENQPVPKPPEHRLDRKVVDNIKTLEHMVNQYERRWEWNRKLLTILEHVSRDLFVGSFTGRAEDSIRISGHTNDSDGRGVERVRSLIATIENDPRLMSRINDVRWVRSQKTGGISDFEQALEFDIVCE